MDYPRALDSSPEDLGVRDWDDTKSPNDEKFSTMKKLSSCTKADFHSAENVARSIFPAGFLLKCVH